MLVYFGASPAENKRYVVKFAPPRTIHFGGLKRKTYVDGVSKQRRDEYARAEPRNARWDQLNAGSLTRHILWGKSRNVQTNLKTTLRLFNVVDARLSKNYVPDSLTDSDKRLQINSILTETRRPKVKSYTSKRSKWVKQFEIKYKVNIGDRSYIDKHILKKEGIDQILQKGRGAYYSSGSRPNQTPSSWAFARLASVILGGPARKSDRAIWDKYKVL